MMVFLQVLLFLWVISLVVFAILAASIATIDEDDLPNRRVMAMIVFWPLTLVVLSPLIIVYVVKWGGILAGSFSGGISELYSKAIKR